MPLWCSMFRVEGWQLASMLTGVLEVELRLLAGQSGACSVVAHLTTRRKTLSMPTALHTAVVVASMDMLRFVLFGGWWRRLRSVEARTGAVGGCGVCCCCRQ
jgi:hypothetical protein